MIDETFVEVDPGFADVTAFGGVDVGYVEIVETPAEVGIGEAEAVADTGPVVKTEGSIATTEPAQGIPDFLAEGGYGAPAAAGDSRTLTAEPEPMGEDLRSERQKLIDAGVIKPAPEPVAAGEEAKGSPLPSQAEIEERRKLRAELETKDDELKAQKAEEVAKAKAEAEKPKAEKPSRLQRLKTGAQKAGSGLRKAAGGVSKGLRKASSGLRKVTPKSATAPPAASPKPKAQTPAPKTQSPATAKTAGPSRAQKLDGALGKLAGAPRSAANALRGVASGMRQTLPQSPPSLKPATKPQAMPEPPAKNNPSAGQNLGRALGSALDLPKRVAQGVREKLPRASEPKEEPKPRGGGEKPTKSTLPTPPNGGSGLPSPGAGLAGLGRVLPLGLAGLAVAFLTAGGVASTTQAVGGIRATPLVVVAAALFAATILLTLFRR